MLKFLNLLMFSLFLVSCCYSQPESLVDYSAYEKLVDQVKSHREKRMLPLSNFLKMSWEEGVIILDTRSKEMYDAKHLKGAIHLNFSDFTQENLSEIIPSKSTKILIYCNNNFKNDVDYFRTKIVIPPESIESNKSENVLGVTMALNIPTYINLFGYGYRNVYELSELVSIDDSRISFQGTAVLK